MAYAFSEKFAAKVSLAYLEGTEWYATDYRNTVGTSRGQVYGSGARSEIPSNTDDPNFNGVNIYGDVASVNLGGAIGRVSRTGYKEVDLINYEAKSTKFNTALHYRPFGNDRLELIWNSKYGTGNTIYQGGQRYSIKNFQLSQRMKMQEILTIRCLRR
jgi:hypothetical protein